MIFCGTFGKKLDEFCHQNLGTIIYWILSLEATVHIRMLKTLKSPAPKRPLNTIHVFFQKLIWLLKPIFFLNKQHLLTTCQTSIAWDARWQTRFRRACGDPVGAREQEPRTVSCFFCQEQIFRIGEDLLFLDHSKKQGNHLLIMTKPIHKPQWGDLSSTCWVIHRQQAQDVSSDYGQASGVLLQPRFKPGLCDQK